MVQVFTDPKTNLEISYLENGMPEINFPHCGKCGLIRDWQELFLKYGPLDTYISVLGKANQLYDEAARDINNEMALYSAECSVCGQFKNMRKDKQHFEKGMRCEHFFCKDHIKTMKKEEGDMRVCPVCGYSLDELKFKNKPKT